MSGNISKSALDGLLSFYKPDTEKEKPIKNNNKTELVKSLPKTKQGLKKLKQQLKYQHSQSSVQERKKGTSEEVPILDKLKKKQTLETSKFKNNLEKLKANRKKKSEKLQNFQDNILNYKVNSPKPKIQKVKRNSNGGFLF